MYQPTINAGDSIQIIDFSNEDKKSLKQFIDFHWKHYKNDPNYIPLLDYEYMGFKLIGIHGFFEADNLFFKHATMRFFLAIRNGDVVGRCNAFVNHNHNKHWKDKVGFFGQFETIDDSDVSQALINASANWLKAQGMENIRGPQNLPVNEATPGLMTQGFDSRPVMYYHYNKPYYASLLGNAGFSPVKRVLSWEVPVMQPMEEKLERVAKKVIKRFDLKFETWGERSLDKRKEEMREIYNDAWNDNYGFVPFTKKEFNATIDDMQLIIDKGLFLFVYMKGEAVGFFGGVPNIVEKLTPIWGCHRCELLRAVKMLLGKNRTKGFRLGYLGVKRRFRRLGLDGVMLWQQKKYCQKKGYEYCDIGWVLEDNKMVVRLVEMMGGEISKIYTIFQKNL